MNHCLEGSLMAILHTVNLRNGDNTMNRRDFFRTSAVVPVAAFIGCGGVKSITSAQSGSGSGTTTTPAAAPIRTQVTITPPEFPGPTGTQGQQYLFPGLNDTMVQSFSYVSVTGCQGMTVQLVCSAPGVGEVIYGWSNGGPSGGDTGAQRSAVLNIIAQ